MVDPVGIVTFDSFRENEFPVDGVEAPENGAHENARRKRYRTKKELSQPEKPPERKNVQQNAQAKVDSAETLK